MRPIRRPSAVAQYAAPVAEWLRENPVPSAVEILRRARLAGYRGGKSALYEFLRRLRRLRLVNRAKTRFAEVGRGRGLARARTNSGGYSSTLRRGRWLGPPEHLPLRQLALCLDCDECFGIGPETCPSCGSATWTSLARFLGQASALRPRRLAGSPSAASGNAEQPVSVRQLVIVARNRRSLYEYLDRVFAANETIRVLLDRRVGERRAHSAVYAVERRHGDRRSPRNIDGLLRAMGWAIIRLPTRENRRGPLRA